jgi:hypothetical protein
MAGKKIAVFSIYQNEKQAERTVDDLMAAGFRNDDVSVLLPDNPGTKDFAHDKGTKAPEGTAAGVTTGGVIGGTLGLLAGIGALAIPGAGPFIAAGPIMPRWLGSEPAALLAVLSARWLGWESRSTKRSATKDTSKRAGFCFPFTARHPK